MFKAVERPSLKPIVPSMITWSYFRRRRRLTIFEPDEMALNILYTYLNSPSRIFALWRSENDSPSLEYDHSRIFLYKSL